MPAPDGATTLMAALNLISTADIELQDIALRRPSLDEVFLQLTGRPEADAAVDVGALT
jgi:ABC-2 type transport system ATP-binding protein